MPKRTSLAAFLTDDSLNLDHDNFNEDCWQRLVKCIAPSDNPASEEDTTSSQQPSRNFQQFLNNFQQPSNNFLQQQDQILAHWRSEFETPQVQRTTTHRCLSPHTPTLFDADGLDYMDDEELLTIPTQSMRSSPKPTLSLEDCEFKTAGGKTIPPPSPANRQKAIDLVSDDLGIGDGVVGPFVGFSTASGKKLKSPSKVAIERADAVLKSVDKEETPITVGFRTASGGKIKSPSKSALQKAQLLCTDVETITEVPPMFTMASGKAIKSPSIDSIQRANSIMDSIKCETPSAFTSASGRVLAPPSTEAIARASRVLSSTDSEFPQSPLTAVSTSLVVPDTIGPTRKSIGSTSDIKKQMKIPNPPFKPPSLLNPFSSAQRSVTRENSFINKLVNSVVPKQVSVSHPTTFEIVVAQKRYPLSAFKISSERRLKTIDLTDLRNQVNVRLPNAPLRWIDNHLLQVIWKLYSYSSIGIDEQFKVSIKSIMDQLCYRYEREINKAERSILKKICERDDSPSPYMILYVFAIEDYSMWLSDGWYTLQVTSDLTIERLIMSGRMRVGQKLKIALAQIVSEEAVEILDASLNGVKLKISGNATRPARWYSKLGRQGHKVTFNISLSSIDADGGGISCVKVAVLRRYPALYMIERESGMRQSVPHDEIDNVISMECEDRIVSIRMTAKFKVIDCCGCSKKSVGIVTLWDTTPEIHARLTEGTLLQIANLKPSIKKSSIVYLSSTRATRVMFSPNSECLDIGVYIRPPLIPECLTSLVSQEEYDLFGAVIMIENDHLWMAIGNSKIMCIKLLRGRAYQIPSQVSMTFSPNIE